MSVESAKDLRNSIDALNRSLSCLKLMKLASNELTY